MKEIWKAVKGYEGKYSVSNQGRIRNERTGKVSYGSSMGHGYKKVTFYENNQPIGREYVHRAVAKAFLSMIDGKPEVNHKDGNRANNRVENLEWVNSSENTEHAVVRKALTPWGHERKPIIATNVETGAIMRFVSISKAEEFFGTRHIDAVLSGKRRTAKGHIFRYAKGGDADVVS
jgi:hypothetical protein